MSSLNQRKIHKDEEETDVLNEKEIQFATAKDIIPPKYHGLTPWGIAKRSLIRVCSFFFLFTSTIIINILLHLVVSNTFACTFRLS